MSAAAAPERAQARLLILLTLPEPVRMQYYGTLREKFPQLAIDLVDHCSKVDPYIEATDILVTFGPMLEDRADAVLGRARSLKWIQALGTGVDNIVEHPSLDAGVIVTNIHGIHGAPVSEAALMAMLALSRDLPRAVRNQQRGAWERWPARLLDGKTVGIFGVGSIAEALAPKCRALGMRVVGISSSPRAVPGFERMLPRERLLEALPELDFLVLLTPYSAATRGIVGAAALAAMKPGACLINLARGGVVDEAALIEALAAGRLRAAALDVFETEPLPAGHPFWAMPNVLITPHLGGFCDVYAGLALPVIEENLRHFLAGETARMRNVVRGPGAGMNVTPSTGS
jgi:phosphoglycerate dehydrogenase-like enzyme